MRPAPKLERISDARKRPDWPDCYDKRGNYRQPSDVPLVIAVLVVCGMCLLAKVWL